MTPTDLSEALGRLTETQFDELKREFGGDTARTREAVVREFVNQPGFERKLCQLLGLKTEDEKLVEAAVMSARAAESSARSADSSAQSSRRSVMVAVVGVVISLLAFALSAFGLLGSYIGFESGTE